MSEEKSAPKGAEATKPAGRGWITATVLGLAIGLAASLAVGWAAFPRLLYETRRQPLDFNHKLHVENAGSCESCHAFTEDGRFPGLPGIDNCVQCHADIQGKDPSEAILVNDYIKKGREIPWLVYSRQPQCVFFSHAAHVFSPAMAKMAGVTPDEGASPGAENPAVCAVCHGHDGDSEHVRPLYVNRITGESRDVYGKNIAGFAEHISDRMKMDACVDCHAKVKPKKEACNVCHK